MCALSERIINTSAGQLRLMQCGSCGVWHAFPETRYDNARRQGGFWYCPNGHCWGWENGEDQEEMNQLRRERDRLKQNEARLEDAIAAERRQTAAAKAETTRLRKRVQNGVCPCCNRSFVDLGRHMKTKHPDVPHLPTAAKLR